MCAGENMLAIIWYHSITMHSGEDFRPKILIFIKI